MLPQRYRVFVLLGALLALLGFFFPLYFSYILAPVLTRGPIDQSIGATFDFLTLLRDTQQQQQAQGVALLLTIPCFVVHWLLLLLALLQVGLSVRGWRRFSTTVRRWSMTCALLGLVGIGLLILSHTFFFVGSVLAFTQGRAATSLTFWDLLQSVGTPPFWRILGLFCTSSYFGIWLPLLGFLSVLGLNRFLKSQKALQVERQNAPLTTNGEAHYSTSIFQALAGRVG